jgi:hypothetical protein
MGGIYAIRALVVLFVAITIPIIVFVAGMANDNSSPAGMIWGIGILIGGLIGVAAVIRWAFVRLGRKDSGPYKPPRIPWFAIVAVVLVLGLCLFVAGTLLRGLMSHSS